MQRLEVNARTNLAVIMTEDKVDNAEMSETILGSLIVRIEKEIEQYSLLLDASEPSAAIKRISFLGDTVQFENLKTFLKMEKITDEHGLNAMDQIFTMERAYNSIGSTRQKLHVKAKFFAKYLASSLCEMELIYEESKPDLLRLCDVSPESARGLNSKTYPYDDFKKKLKKSI